MTADTRRHVQFVLASLGLASLLGSTFGAAFAWTRTCWCCWDVESEEPL